MDNAAHYLFFKHIADHWESRDKIGKTLTFGEMVGILITKLFGVSLT